MIAKRDPRELSGDRFAWSDWGASCSGAESLSPLVHRKPLWAAKFARSGHLRLACCGDTLPFYRWGSGPILRLAFRRPRYLTAFDANSGVVDCFGDSVEDLCELLERFEKRGVALVSVAESLKRKPKPGEKIRVPKFFQRRPRALSGGLPQ